MIVGTEAALRLGSLMRIWLPILSIGGIAMAMRHNAVCHVPCATRIGHGQQ